MRNSDVQGSVAIGGALDIGSYGVASRQQGDAAQLLVGGSLAWTSSGSVGGGSGLIKVGGAAQVSPSVGRRELATGTATLDFPALKGWYLALSDKLAQQSGSNALHDGYGQYTCRGSDPKWNVCTLTGAQLDQGDSLVFDVPENASVLVNVTGTTAAFSNGQNYWGSQAMQDHPKAAQVLYNFPQATRLDVSGWSPQGTLLAPRARLNHQNANINGQVIVNELDDTGEFHCGGAFQGPLPVQP